MKKIALLLVLTYSFLGFSQTNEASIKSYLDSNRTTWNLTSQDVSDWIVESKATSKSTKINNYYIKQRHQGIEIFGAVSNVWVKNNKVINVNNRFVANASQKINTTNPTISVITALEKAKTVLAISNTAIHTIVENVGDKKFVISNGTLSPIKATLVFQKVADKLRLAWDLKIDAKNQNHYWSVRIDALNGTLLDQNDWVVSCHYEAPDYQQKDTNFYFNPLEKTMASSILEVQSGSYRVIPYNIESPNHGARQLVVSPSNATASPFGWHDDDGLPGSEYMYTRGNNVYAYEDINDISTGISAEGGVGLVFDFPYGGTNVPATSYTEAAITNLFYMNNIMHDVFYNYGFDEENGNFQSNNYGNGGAEFDQVYAEAQDGGGINNANFATPPDGEGGWMQMYLWNRKAKAEIIKVNAPAAVAGNYFAFDNSFDAGHVNLPIFPATLTANLALFEDATDDPNDACSTAINAAALNGKIVVIRRGVCSLPSKVLRAQSAGAAAVLMVSNTFGNFHLTGDESDITIPAISVNQEVGEALISAMQTGTVNVSLSLPFPSDFINADGDFDNLIIAHEYGHGISNRLTGGSFNADCLNNQEQMGEGWSDWFGLMLQMKAGDTETDKRGVGTFAANQATTDSGIRQYPYSTDMTINPFTFGNTNTVVRPHGVGSVWATMLWDLAWAYVDKYGYDPNVYSGNGGNNKVLQIVIDALKLQPCDPSFVDGRDAIIAADQAITGGADFCLIWQVFARRGLGLNATSGDPFSSTDQTEDFTVPLPGPNCNLGIDYFQNEEFIKAYPNPTDGKLTIAIRQFVGKADIQVTDVNGRIISEFKNLNFNGQAEIDLSSYQSGLYFVKITSETVKTTKKIILK